MTYKMLTPLHKRRISTIVASGFVLMVVLALILYALKQNIDVYFTPKDVTADMQQASRVIKLGGMVVKGSIKRFEELHIQFTVTDFEQSFDVDYNGILPDLFAENQGVVAEGRFDKGVFKANFILAKHDENYMPPEIARKMKLS